MVHNTTIIHKNNQTIFEFQITNTTTIHNSTANTPPTNQEDVSAKAGLSGICV
ncbi:MAG: hypothetical protein LBH74_05420 [Nitrososphaerota archaeon]|nr:hypothetical protein [Nitrososphaerota archaeon]